MGDLLDSLTFITNGLLWLAGGLLATLIAVGVVRALSFSYERIAFVMDNVREREIERQLREADLQAKILQADLVPYNPLNGLPQLPKEVVAAVGAEIYARYFEANKTHPAPIHHYAPHYAPEYEYRGLPGAQGAQVVEPAGLLSAPFTPPDFWQLFHGDKLPEKNFLLGYRLDDHQEVLADWGNLYSALVGGQSGSGKSTLIRCLLAQAALKGSQFVVVDPHAKAGPQSLAASIQPLSKFMPFPPAGGSEQEMLEAVRYVNGVARSRLGGEGPGQPLILVVDELTSILQGRHGATLKDEMVNVLQQIATESRKVGVFAFGIGQNFNGKFFDTTVRDNFVSMLSCRARQRVARTMADDNEFGKTANDLATGQAVWLTPQGDMLAFSFPNTTEEHLTLVARQVASNGHWEVDPLDYGSTSGGSGFTGASKRLPVGFNDAEDWPVNGATGSPGEAPVKSTGSQPDARSVRVKELLRQGFTAPQILREVWRVDSSKGGKAYQEAQAELTVVINALIGGD